MPICPICESATNQRTIVQKFEKKSRGHMFCQSCGASYDSDALTMKSLQSITEVKDFRTAYVETPHVANEAAEIYTDFGWEDQDGLKEAIIRPAVLALRRHAPGQQLHILDVGCANGFSTKILTREFGSAIGIDPSPSVKELGANGVVGTLETIRFDDESFDAVVIVGNLMLHRDIGQTMRDVLRILKPGGVAFIDFKNIRSASRVIARSLAAFSNSQQISRNFSNMRYGLGRQHIGRIAEGFEVLETDTIGPRLLRFANSSQWQAGVRGIAWRALDIIDRMRGEQAWVQVVLRKPDSEI